MPKSDPNEIAEALRVGIGLLVRRLRQLQIEGSLTLPETAALKRLEAGGPTTATELAKQEQISPQSMGATLNALEGRRFIRRLSDPHDGRRSIVAMTPAGGKALRENRSVRTRLLAQAIAAAFTREELHVLAAAAPLVERLAERL
ncbi:MAG TPA: MarR family transcriptional regulator [Candidatus Acidoferrales bacterium]|nr:MarR family transcriptional regulator [Candidatus Acidoferrales bacterium]